MSTENNNLENSAHDKNWVEHAKNYIETQRENNEEPTKEGWFEILKEDLVGGWDEMVETFADTWEVANKMVDSFFGMDKDQK
ncbi:MULTISPECIES: hypothetical protein [Amniculibacterium]|uniref:hypothetical protein n=1 Tax=Amniculibacterium TaxID=2715289 RepID=UPI000F59DBA0|nr:MULTISPECIES: hypothetical protein [Amniculibacterium]